MDTGDFVYSVESRKPFDEAAVAVLAAVDKAGWAVFAVYDLQERLAAKGFSHGRLKVMEICNAKHSDALLRQEPLSSLCMPCRISLIERSGRTVIAAMRPSAMRLMFPMIGRDDAEAVEKGLVSIIQASA